MLRKTARHENARPHLHSQRQLADGVWFKVSFSADGTSRHLEAKARGGPSAFNPRTGTLGGVNDVLDPAQDTEREPTSTPAVEQLPTSTRAAII